MNAIVIQHVPLVDLPPAWQERLSCEPEFDTNGCK